MKSPKILQFSITYVSVRRKIYHKEIFSSDYIAMIIIRNSRLPKVKKTDIPQPQYEVITYRMTIITGGDQKIYY